jgi:hypothetical protein
MFLFQAIVLYSVGFALCEINRHVVTGAGGNMYGNDLHDLYQCFPHPIFGITLLGVPREIV